MRRVTKKRSFFILASLLVLAVFYAGCNKENLPNEPLRQHVNYLLPATPLSVDPAFLRDEAGYQLVTSLWEGLVRLEADGSLGKALAEDWQISEDGKKYVFTLRDANWSNGSKLTAFDFEAAWKRNLTPGNNSPVAYLLYDIKNAENYHRLQDENYGGKKASLEEVGIKATDERTLVVELEKNNPVFLSKLVHPVFYPLPPEAINDQEGTFFQAAKLIGNGPFKISEEVAGDRYELVKNEQYWEKDKVKLARMTWFLPSERRDGWAMFEEGKLDLTGDVPFDRVEKGLAAGELKSAPLLTTYYYQFNTAKPPFNDVKVRQALSFSLDREKLIREYLKGGQKPAGGIIPEGMPESAQGGDFHRNSEKKVPAGDEKKASALLAEAGFSEGKGFPETELLVSEQEGHRYFAEKIRQEWQEKLGLKLQIVTLSWPELRERMSKRDYQLALMGWSADFADPLPYLQSFMRGSGNNTTGWANPEYDRLLEKAASAASEEERSAALHQAENILLEEGPVLPLYQFTKVYAARDVVQDLFVSPLGFGFDFRAVHIAKPEN
ncbi:MAG TPA: peptide ABC transporter substrate-binding protein [Peptococcaceae bacterium]|nr:peptide ABC transporter substrate-binding protein [Clostridia bacterium]HOB82446.1 peptide ABC transporter substrate-binding protein [Peptococcaceae bacterium]HQD53518.1 peptide ABC transporter substrate-binding protein [Peptococcaceae bacterium]